MKRLFKIAIEEIGCSEFIDRWQLPDGMFLNWPDGQDHRWCGQWCINDWREFLMEGAVSVHWDAKAHYLWIRTIGLNAEQRMVWASNLEEMSFRITELKVDFYEFDSLEKYTMEVIELDDEELINLYLTDIIGYQMRTSEMERN